MFPEISGSARSALGITDRQTISCAL